MKAQPTLVRVLTPPPIGPSNLIQGPTAQSVTSHALAVHLAKSVPFSSSRSSPFKLHLITVHPNLPLVTYLIVPEGGNEKKKYPKTIVVQHVQTKQVLYSLTLGELASILFNYDAVIKDESDPIAIKQHKALKNLGQVQRLDFFDPSTLYWSGHGTLSGPQDAGKRWSYLLVQLQSRLVIVNLRQQSVVIAKGIIPSIKTEEHIFQPVIANITQDSLGAAMSSNAVPVSRENVLVGTTDGSVKIFNWKANVVVQSVKVATNKHDTVVQIISTNKYDTPDRYAAKTRRRVVCLTQKGAALLLELLVVEGIVHDITPPFAKFEGGSVPASMSKQDDEHASMEHILVQYCGFRDLLLWSYPSKNAKGKLLAWDLGDIPEADTKKLKGDPDDRSPLLVMQFPYETTHTIFPGWFNESMPMESMACAAVTKDGDFQILVAPLYNSGSSVKNPYAAFTVLSVNLHQIVQRDLLLPEEREITMKAQSIFCPPLRDSSIFYFGTSLGILMVKMVDGNLVQVPGTRHAHLSANFGGMGKAILSVKGPEINYAILEAPGGPLAMDPLGYMESKNTTVVYESPAPLHLPPEIHKRPVRLPPLFLVSPSRSFLCCFWKEEMRYEVLHISSLLEKVTSRTQINKSPVVASGNGVASFAWVGDEDVFSLLYNPEQDLALKVGIDLSAPTQSLGKDFASAAGKITDITKLKDLRMLKDIASGKKLGKKVSKLQSLKGLQDLGKGTVKGVAGIGKGMGKVSVGTLKMTGKVTLAATKGTAGLAGGATKLAVGGTTKMVGGGAKVAKLGFKAATFGMLRTKKKSKEADSSLATTDGGEDDDTIATNQTPLGIIGEVPSAAMDVDKLASEQLERKFPWVELRSLVGSDGTDSASNVTPTGLGELSLRSGNRNPPTVLFGGPVLCVASKNDENDEGLAYFYTKKKGATEESAAEYSSSGPAFPCPDSVVWDDDGRVCAVIIQSMVSIYLSEEPEFVMLGTLKVGTPADVDIQVISARFLHGALFVTTRSAVQVIFLGDLDGGTCHVDMFTLASSDVSVLPSKSIAMDYKSLSPPTVPMPLNYPSVLGYQNGALMISTVSGIQAIPLGSPLLRIGALLGAGHPQKAEKWFDAVPPSDHEALANFLERRGVPEMALQLSGISLETIVDYSMRYGYVDRLEEAIEQYGLKGLRAIDMSRGVSSNIFGPVHHGASVVVCVAAYLLSQGRVELVRRLATECLSAGEEGKREAFMLASLLVSVDAKDSKRVMLRAVQDEQHDSDWLVGSFVRANMFAGR